MPKYASQLARMLEAAGLDPEKLLDVYADPVKAYKLFRKKGEDLYPLFVNADKPVMMDEWLPAEAGALTDKGQVKSSIGPLAYRPGWHAGEYPLATHIGGKATERGKIPTKPNYRPDDQVWAEIEMPGMVNWQQVADSRARITKAGRPDPKTAHITDQVPFGGHYRYKTNPNMTGDWLIGGDMKVNRVLEDDEVRELNRAAGVEDLPRLRNLQRRKGYVPAVAGAVGLGALSDAEESEAAVVPRVLQSGDDILHTLSTGGVFPGAEGKTFLTPKSEAKARIYDNLRTQARDYGTPVFDLAGDAGSVSAAPGPGAAGPARYTLPGEYADQLGQLGVSTPDLIELPPSEAAEFANQITSAKQANKYGSSVYVYPTEEYENMRLFMTPDKSAGYALKPDGDVVSAFSTGANKGVAPHMILHAIEQGGQKLDAFDTVLPDMYSQMGFREGGRLRWDDSQAPPDWDKELFGAYNQGEPDVSFMGYDERPAVPVEKRYVDDYGQAMEGQQSAIRPAAAAVAATAAPGALADDDRAAYRTGVPSGDESVLAGYLADNPLVAGAVGAAGAFPWGRALEQLDMPQQGLFGLLELARGRGVAPAAQAAQGDPWEMAGVLGDEIKGDSASAGQGLLGDLVKWGVRLGSPF